ncbi:MAG: hypothetical protein ABI142_08610 [Bryocella sp.]
MPRSMHGALKREAASRRIAVSSLIEQCVRDHYDPEQAKAEQNMLLKEIRTLDRRMGAVTFSNRVLVELVTLSMKNLFSTVSPPTAAQRAAGQGFYAELLAAVTRNLCEDTPVLDRIMASVMRAEDPNFFPLDPSTHAHKGAA